MFNNCLCHTLLGTFIIWEFQASGWRLSDAATLKLLLLLS